MTEQEKAEFKSVIFDPMNEAWAIMKWMRDTEPKDDKFWGEYYDKATKIPEKYGHTEISQSISRVVLDAGSEYQRIKGQK